MSQRLCGPNGGLTQFGFGPEAASWWQVMWLVYDRCYSLSSAVIPHIALLRYPNSAHWNFLHLNSLRCTSVSIFFLLNKYEMFKIKEISRGREKDRLEWRDWHIRKDRCRQTEWELTVKYVIEIIPTPHTGMQCHSSLYLILFSFCWLLHYPPSSPPTSPDHLQSLAVSYFLSSFICQYIFKVCHSFACLPVVRVSNILVKPTCAL